MRKLASLKVLVLIGLVANSVNAQVVVDDSNRAQVIEDSANRLQAFIDKGQPAKVRHVASGKTKSKDPLTAQEYDEYIIALHEAMEREKYLDGDRYIIRVAYDNDQGFPRKYALTDEQFIKKGLALYPKESESEVFLHYLGKDFEKYSPKLIAVNDSVVLKFSIDSPNELSNILGDFPVAYVLHAADPVPDPFEELVR